MADDEQGGWERQVTDFFTARGGQVFVGDRVVGDDWNVDAEVSIPLAGAPLFTRSGTFQVGTVDGVFGTERLAHLASPQPIPVRWSVQCDLLEILPPRDRFYDKPPRGSWRWTWWWIKDCFLWPIYRELGWELPGPQVIGRLDLHNVVMGDIKVGYGDEQDRRAAFGLEAVDA